MKPIGQTFFIKEPPRPTGTVGVFITRIDVYFQSVDPNLGIEMQIRETLNGVPTSSRLPFGTKMLTPGDSYSPTNAKNGNQYELSYYSLATKQFVRWNGGGANLIGGPRASTDASIPTPFIFNSPVFVESGKSYAFVLLPAGGNPNYKIWTAAIGATVDGPNGSKIQAKDTLTNNPIDVNNDSGDLFISSNDIAWQPLINEDIKYTIYTADFLATSGTAYFSAPSEDWVIFKNEAGKLKVREPIVFGNGYINTALLTISACTGVIAAGDTVIQTDGETSVTGVVYGTPGATLKISNASGAFTTTIAGTPKLYKSGDAGVYVTVDGFNQNVTTVATSNVVSVPDASLFATNDIIYIQTNNRSTTQVVKVTVPSLTTTTFQVNSQIAFTDNNCLIGKVKGNGDLTGRYSGSIVLNNLNYGIIDGITSTSGMNLASANKIQKIGINSGSSAELQSIIDSPYNSITTNFNSIAVPNTSLDWSFRGFRNNNLKTQDSDFIKIRDGLVNELTDFERLAMSRSNELSLPGGRTGNSSVVIKVGMTSQNNKISPVIDTIRNNVTYTYNIIPTKEEISGVYLSIETNSGPLPNNYLISQNTFNGTATGYIAPAAFAPIAYANSTYMRLINVTGKFVSDKPFTCNNGITGVVTTAEQYNESLRNGYYKTSRYIAKNVILAKDQDAEDIRVYLAAYRPANTDVYVYAAIKNNYDNDQFTNKAWSKLKAITPASLQSSKVNIDDQVELVYTFPRSENVFLQNTVTNNTAITFNSKSAVNDTSNFITLSNNGFTNEDIVTYKLAAGNTTLAALTADNDYYVVQANSIGIKLSDTLNGTELNIANNNISEVGHSFKTKSSKLMVCEDATGLANGMFIYMVDGNNTSKPFNAREIVNIVNTTAFVVDRPPSFTTTNSSLGIIPGIESTTSAFLYDQNENIVRYSTIDDAVYDGYIQFAIKIVPVADSTSLVPRIGDLRVLALQV